jgi:hypothetical protein
VSDKITPGIWGILEDRMGGDGAEVWGMQKDGTARHVASHLLPADARLIAAAPELLSALIELVDYDEGSSEEGDYGYEVLHRCKAAITKAGGRGNG